MLDNNDTEMLWKNLKRLVDDDFVLFEKPERLQQFATYMNTWHPHIWFSIEADNNGDLPFLTKLHNSTLRFAINERTSNTYLATCDV